MTSPQAEYDLTAEDIRAFYTSALPRSPLARRQMRIVQIVSPLFIIGAGLLLFWALGSGFPPNGARLLVIGLTAFLAMWFTPTTVRSSQIRQIMKMFASEERRKQFGPTKVVLNPEGFVVTSPLGASQFPWAAIGEIVLTNTHIFFHLDSLAAVIIPQRAFADATHFERFVDAAKLYHRNGAIARSGE